MRKLLLRLPRSVTDAEIHASVESYYSEKVRQHGATAAGVDWRDESSQNLRFAQFSYLWRKRRDFSLNDLGSGYGALWDYLHKRRYKVDYSGIDLSDEMVQLGIKRNKRSQSVAFVRGSSPDRIADFTVASGIFNVKGDRAAADWQDYILRTIEQMAHYSSVGFGFNILSDHSDKHLQRPDLFYADPGEFVDYCGRRSPVICCLSRTTASMSSRCSSLIDV